MNVFFQGQRSIGHVSRIVGPIYIKQKGSTLFGCLAKYVSLTFDITYDFDLEFSGSQFKSAQDCCCDWCGMQKNQIDLDHHHRHRHNHRRYHHRQHHYFPKHLENGLIFIRELLSTDDVFLIMKWLWLICFCFMEQNSPTYLMTSEKFVKDSKSMCLDAPEYFTVLAVFNTRIAKSC